MAINITKRPEKYIGSQFSRWTALHNPINFEVSRTDFNVINTAIRAFIHPTLPTVKTDANPAELPLFVQPGDRIYLKSGVYTGIQTVLSVTGQYITIDATYSNVGGSGWVNLIDYLTNFKIGFRLRSNITGEIIDGGFYTPDGTGLAIINVNGLLKKLLVTEDNYSYILQNQKNDGLSGGFAVEYSINYNIGELNIAGTYIADSTEYFWLSAAQQVLDFYGQNMADFVPLNQADYYAKFLTLFNQPTIWVGLPSAIHFIYSEQFPTTYLVRHQQNLDANGNPTSAESTQILLNSEAGFMNAMALADPDADTAFIDFWIETGGAIPEGGDYVDDGFMDAEFVSEYSAPTSGG